MVELIFVKYTKQPITVPAQMLSSIWPVEDLNLSMDKELSSNLAIAEDEIKNLISQGWTKVELPRFNNLKHSVDVNEWVENHCGKSARLGRKYVFEETSDAILFIFRWCDG